MSQKNNTSYVEKKYNHDTDIVPLHPSGFSLGSSDKDDLVVIDFFYDSKKNNKNQRIDLGSFVMSNNMADELAKMIKEDSNKKINKKLEDDTQSK